jgi:hypothetical protein
MPLPAGSFGASPLMRRRTRADEHAAGPAASEPGHCAMTGNDPSSACAPHLRNAAPDSSCPALTKPTAVRSSHLLQQPSHELVITLDPEPLALRSTRNRRRSNAPGVRSLAPTAARRDGRGGGGCGQVVGGSRGVGCVNAFTQLGGGHRADWRRSPGGCRAHLHRALVETPDRCLACGWAVTGAV